jgi:hypothetical protein
MAGDFAVLWEIPEIEGVEGYACQRDLIGGHNGNRSRWKRK